jgi:hypothetical protein
MSDTLEAHKIPLYVLGVMIVFFCDMPKILRSLTIYHVLISAVILLCVGYAYRYLKSRVDLYIQWVDKKREKYAQPRIEQERRDEAERQKRQKTLDGMIEKYPSTAYMLELVLGYPLVAK